MAENKYSWYYRQIDENEKNIQKNLVHVANNEPKEKPKFIVPDSERYLNNIRVCKIPDIYGNFKINSENDFVITFQHLYTMQSSEEAGFYTANSKWVHYHSLGKNLLYDLPQLLENPEIILSSSSQEEQSYSNSDNTTLACVLKENVTLSIDGKEEDCPVVAMIKPNITDDKATIILTAYPKQDFERFLQKGIEQNRLLYLKNEEVLRRDYPVVETNRVATVSFNGLLYTNNIAQFKENVNLLRVENNGMALQTIPDEEKTIKVCNAAKRENPAAVMFFTERQRSVKLYTEVFETLDKTAIQNIPETYFINSLKNYLHKSMPKKYNNQPKMAFSAINKRITNTQKELIKQTIRTEYDIYDDSEEITDYLIISEFKDWAENQSPLIQNQNMPAQEGNKMKEFNYYGITLNIQDNENGTVDIVEPAFNTNISTEQKQETAISYVQSLDEKAGRSELCKNAKSKNYIPEIIRKIIEKGAEVINEKINKPLISFVEKHKEEIISSTKKGLAIAAVLGASLAASPELFASTSSEIQTDNKNVIEYQYSTPFYRSYDDLENKITVFERYSDGEWEKSGFTTLTDYEIELLYGNQNEQKEESAAAEVDNTEEEVTEQNITPDPEPNETADEDKNSEEFVNEEIPVVDNSVENISQAGSSLESENAGQTENQPKLSDTNQKIEINSESQIKEENLMSETIKNMQGTVKESMNTENNDSEPIKAPDNSSDKLTPFEYLMQKINGSQIKVHLSKKEMQAILTAGKDVQKMAVSYGTNQKIENEQGFLGYGTYVVSVNEENAKQLGIKIASRKYGGTFYINNRPLSEFLQEQNFSTYWIKQLEQFKTTSIDELTAQISGTDVKGNANLAAEQNKLSTVLGLGLVEYKREQTFLYSVNIPDNDNTNYLFYDKAIGLEHAIKINEQLEKLGVNWRVSRNDSGKDVYFNVLSQKVFNNNQKQASEFLKSIGYVGMEMSGNNYIVFNDKDMSITNRVQYYKDTNGEVFGFAYEGEIYADEELVNSNVIAHEYTHIWDGYVKNNNPELWQRGKNILKGTSLWQEVAEDKNYENLKTDDEILSECHSRIVGKMAEQVLEKIAQRDGGLTRDQVIDWDKEVSDYIVSELKIKPELGEENSISESEKAEYLKEFLSQPMKDLNFETIQKMAEPTQGENSIEDSIVDKGIESVQANDGLSEAATEADIAAIDNQRADYLDEDGNPHFYDEPEPAQEELPYFYDTNDNPHTTSEVYEVLEKFSNLEPEKWNLSPEDKVAVSHLIDVSQIKEVDKDKAFENLSNYLLSEEYKREESNYAKVLTPVLLSYNQEQNNFDFTFSTDEMQKQQSETSVQQKSEITKGEIKSILGNTFTGENVKLTEEFQDKLIKKGLVNPGDEFILLNELEAHAKGTKIKEDQPYVILTTPVQVNGKTQFAATKYYHISAVEEPLKITETAEQKPNETDMDKIIFGKTKVAEFSMHTNHGFEVFENMVVDSHEESTNSYLLKSSDGKNQVRVEAETLKELMSEPYQKKAMSYDEETKIQEKMIESQYKSFFEPRDNFANNFRHNLALYCRKEANSPLDALKIANSLIKQMPDEERNKTKQLLKKLCNKGQTINEVIIETYNTAVKDVPLNENYLNNKRYEKMIQRPMYDTCTAKGEKVDNNFDLKIGDNVKVKFKAGKVFGKGKEKVLSEVKIVSSSKEGNCVTLMDGNKSFYDVPRDTFLKDYGKQLVKEHQMTKKQFAKHSMKLDTGRER